jgi:hypothetical protein
MTVEDRFAEVVRRRSELAAAMQRVEAAAAAPIGKESWVADLRTSLEHLEQAWSHHTETTQSPMGLLDRVVEEAPRLQRAVAAMRADHGEMANTIGVAHDLVTKADDDADPDPLREAALEALVAVARHRQRGADIIFEAFAVDIGGY